MSSEQELSAIYENIPGIVFYIAVEPDGEFRFLSVSRDFLAATGMPRQQVVGSLVRNVIPPPLLGIVLNHYREAIRSRQPMRWEEESVYPAGRRYGEVAVTPLFDASGVATHLIGIVHDITERKREEEVLLRHAAIVESSEDAVISKNLDGVITSWNAGAEHIFGYTREEAVGHSITMLIPSELQEEESKIRETLRAGGRIEHYETVRVTKAEKKVDLSLSICPIKNSTGEVAGFSKIARDISERKRAEQALAEMTGKLIEAQEQERTRIGRELHDDISQRLAMLAIEPQRLQIDSLPRGSLQNRPVGVTAKPANGRCPEL